MNRLWPVLGCGVLLGCVLGGCSSFDADYQRLGQTAPAQSAFMAGAWDGHWESQKGFGSGRLQSVISKDPAKQTSAGGLTAAGTYDAYFKATYGGILKAEYQVPIQATADLGQMTTVKIHTDHDLGPGIGKYTMDGEATPTAFGAKYKSDYDEGVIELHRADPKAAP